MKNHKVLLFSILVITLVIGACASTSADTTMTDEPADLITDSPMETEMMKDTSTPEAMMGTPTQDMIEDVSTPEAMTDNSSEGSMMETPDWFSVVLNNVTDGSTFSISDFKGKVVLVETMAIWCPKCKAQQEQIKSLRTQLGMPSDLVTIALDIDPNENEDMLRDYAAVNGFDWIYAVAPADIAREIGNLYGAQFLNPTSTPILIVDPKGEVHLLPFGNKSANDLKKAIEPYLNDM